MPGCNGPDRGCNITSRESALTSVRCSGAKLLSDSVEGSMREHRSRCLRPPLRRENLGMAMRRRQLDGAGCTNVCGLGMLEPYAGKLARTVLRGGCAGNGVALPAHKAVFLTNNKQEVMEVLTGPERRRRCASGIPEDAQSRARRRACLLRRGRQRDEASWLIFCTLQRRGIRDFRHCCYSHRSIARAGGVVESLSTIQPPGKPG
ncbi:hypothetical protein OKW33_004228 [Paraburkholderia atlantica]